MTAITAPGLGQMKSEGRKIVALTAYDFTFARVLENAGVDIVLVGDTLGMVVQGRSSTLPVTLEDIIYHSRCVAPALNHALLLADMPFGSYQEGPEQAVRNASRLMAAGQAQMVKLEGGAFLAETIAFLTERGIPVCAHIGLTPQYVHQFGGFRVQGREERAAGRLRADAHALEQAGASLIVLEAIPAPLAQEITMDLTRMPTIGIGAGAACDGQVLVLPDLLGIVEHFRPRFVRNFMEGASSIQEAVGRYVSAVRAGDFPGPEHSFHA